MPYDPSKAALFHPELAPTVFRHGDRPDLISLAVEASRLAYLRTEESRSELARLEDALKRVGYRDVKSFDHPGTDGQGFGAISDSNVLLAFRGTQADRATDLVIDAETTLREWPKVGGRVHKGFARAAVGLWDDDVEDWLARLQSPPRKLLICGHSLGAAVATLLALPAHEALKLDDKATTLITIGSPRVGDEEFVKKIQARLEVLRLVNCCDLVTELPPSLGILPFQHTEPSIYIRSDGERDDKADRRSDRAQAREDYLRSQSWRWGTAAVRDLADHAPANYIRAFWPPRA